MVWECLSQQRKQMLCELCLFYSTFLWWELALHLKFCKTWMQQLISYRKGCNNWWWSFISGLKGSHLLSSMERLCLALESGLAQEVGDSCYRVLLEWAWTATRMRLGDKGTVVSLKPVSPLFFALCWGAVTHSCSIILCCKMVYWGKTTMKRCRGMHDVCQDFTSTVWCWTVWFIVSWLFFFFLVEV